MTDTHAPAIRTSGLRKTFRAPDGRTVVAVDGVDLVVEPGEIVAFLGPNGAGKTTTVDMLLGLTSPDAGSVEVFGGPPRRAVTQGRVSAVMQTGGLLKDLTPRLLQVRSQVAADRDLRQVPPEMQPLEPGFIDLTMSSVTSVGSRWRNGGVPTRRCATSRACCAPTTTPRISGC